MRKAYERRSAWFVNRGKKRRIDKTIPCPVQANTQVGELLGFVEKVRPRKITPTVNADTEKDRDSYSNGSNSGWIYPRIKAAPSLLFKVKDEKQYYE